MNPTKLREHSHTPSWPLPLLATWILSFLLVSCETLPSSADQNLVSSLPPSQPTIIPTDVEPTLTPTTAVTSFSPPYPVWLDSPLPDQIESTLLESEFYLPSPDIESAAIKISTDRGEPAGSWFYIAAAPFYSLVSDIDVEDLRSCWDGYDLVTDDFDHIIISDDTATALALVWGPSKSSCVTITDQLLTKRLWLDTAGVTILPFELVSPDYKILSINGSDPLAPDFDPTNYPLKIPLYAQASPAVLADIQGRLPISNFNQNMLTSVALTGVTAMVRDTAVIMEEKGITYPAGDIQDLLSTADITHINNEVPFAEDCPTPVSSQKSLRFCSDDDYLGLLKAVGTDIVELSGDHFGDWGPAAMLHTLDLYVEAGIPTYGGGRDLSSGLAPQFMDHNGNQFAFIGCNAKAVDRYATASDSNPGAARCDFDWVIKKIRDLKDQGYLVIATMQHEEVDRFDSIALQQYDFRRLAKAGAVIVSGSQAHHPQGFEYNGLSFIHYGLGNLFFDQWYLAQYNPEVHINKDKSFIDLHYFYNGNYISTRLIPLQFIDNARPRFMTSEETADFLEQVFQASLWNGKWINLYSSHFYSEGN